MATTDPLKVREAAILAAKDTDARWCGIRLTRMPIGRLAAIVDAVLAVTNIENDNAGDDHLCEFCGSYWCGRRNGYHCPEGTPDDEGSDQ